MLNRFGRVWLSSFLTVALLFAAQVPVAQAGSCRELLTPMVAAIPAAARTRTEAEIRTLKVLSYNVENLFMNTFRGEWKSPGVMVRDRNRQQEEPKSPQDIEAIRRIILESQADLLVLAEVENVEALQNLAAQKLAGLYRALLVQGNDPRGINIGFLVKADLPWSTRIVSNKNVRWRDEQTGHEGPLFSRDLPVVELRRKETDRDPLFAIIGNHAKSKRDMEGDHESTRWRTAQYAEAAKIAQGYMNRGVHILFAGDFNTDIRRDPEVRPILGVLKSSLAIAPDAVPVEQRVTHTFHQNGTTKASQLDDVMVSPDLAGSVLSARILRYKDAQGRELPLPTTYEQRSRQPSDHFPVLTEISTGVLFN